MTRAGRNATEAPSGASVALLRQGLYRFFAATLLPPDAERLAALAAAAATLETMGIEAFAFAGPWRRAALLAADPPPVTAAQAEYVRLFEATSGPAHCPPVESHYVTSARDGGAARVASEVERAYREAGLALAPGRPPDGASQELELMAYLCSREVVAREHGSLGDLVAVVERQERFVGEHLSRWFGMFARAVDEAARIAFYPGIVTAAAVFIDHDHEMLRILVDRR